MARILIVDDEENIRSTLSSALKRRGHQVVTAENFAEGDRLGRAGFDLIFLDVLLPDGNGVELLKMLKASDPNQVVIMISGHADIDTAVDAIQSGAYDFIEKPLSLERVLITIENATQARTLLSEKERLSSRLYGDFIGQSAEVIQLRQRVVQAASRTDRFLITGENGTGKELIAHLIHRSGNYADGPFVAVNCAALPAELVESELFGHLSGSFTGAGKNRKGRFVEADGGTIFLDEISDMSTAAQAKILRVLESREVVPVGGDRPIPVKGNVIAASNADLSEMVESGRFRRDLLYRLNVVEFHLPPLRARRDDIPLLVAHFMAGFARESATGRPRLDDGAIKAITELDFPGNVRELKNLIERLNIYCQGPIIELRQIRPFLSASSGKESDLSLKEATSQFEAEYIRAAIARNNGNMARTARQLEVERSHLYKKVRKYRLDRE